MTQSDIGIAELMARLTALERERAAITAEIEPAISSIGIRQSKVRLLCFDSFSVAVRMSSPSVGKIARRGAADMHLPVRMNGSVGFAKSRKSNVRRVQIRHSWP
jgi:hypothetical protein